MVTLHERQQRGWRANTVRPCGLTPHNSGRGRKINSPLVLVGSRLARPARRWAPGPLDWAVMLHNAHIPIVGFAAFSGTGKTTLLKRLMPLLRGAGLRVGVVKHAHHAFEIDRELDGASLTGRELWLEAGEPVPDRGVRRTPRIGVDYAGPWARRRYRFVVTGHPDVSGPKALR